MFSFTKHMLSYILLTLFCMMFMCLVWWRKKEQKIRTLMLTLL